MVDIVGDDAVEQDGTRARTAKQRGWCVPVLWYLTFQAIASLRFLCRIQKLQNPQMTFVQSFYLHSASEIQSVFKPART